MWRLRQHLLNHKAVRAKAQEMTTPDHAYAEERRLMSSVDSRLPPSSASDHLYATSASEATAASSRSDHPYSTTKEVAATAEAPVEPEKSHVPVPQETLREEQQQQLQVRLKKIDHLYSSPSSPASPGTHQAAAEAAAGTAGTAGAGATAATSKRAKRQSVRALGHSYAAIRPRRASNCGGGGGGGGGRGAGAGGGGERQGREGLSTTLYPCDQCDKEFPQPYRLNRHIREVHVRERKHCCRFCDKSFFKVTSKERHELTHTEHQLWRCAECQKCFRDQTCLKYHQTKNVCLKRAARAKADQRRS